MIMFLPLQYTLYGDYLSIYGSKIMNLQNNKSIAWEFLTKYEKNIME